jgi:N6-adenosine-specific RNA methylase IME4
MSKDQSQKLRPLGRGVVIDLDHLDFTSYRCVLLDAPWLFKAGTKGRPQHYPRMSDEEIAALPLASLAHGDGCWFFVWITSAIDGPRFWEGIWPSWRDQGLRYSGRAFVWFKTRRKRNGAPFLFPDSFHSGTGFTTRKNAEDVLLFKTGEPKRLARDVREEIVAPIREHSRKPDEIFTRIERFCAGPRVELFARESREGWDSAGNETDKFD